MIGILKLLAELREKTGDIYSIEFQYDGSGSIYKNVWTGGSSPMQTEALVFATFAEALNIMLGILERYK